MWFLLREAEHIKNPLLFLCVCKKIKDVKDINYKMYIISLYFAEILFKKTVTQIILLIILI